MAACTCRTCGATFNRCPAKQANGEGKYCSTGCRAAAAGYRNQVRAALPGTIADIAAHSSVAIETVRDQLVGLQKRGEAHAARLVSVPADQLIAADRAMRSGTRPALALMRTSR